MGIKNLKQQFPWTDVRDWIVEFPGTLLLVDAANILFWCARTNFATFITDNYLPAVADFCKYMNYMVARKAHVRLFFDGLVNPDKKFEDARRKAAREGHKKAVTEARAKDAPPCEGDMKALVRNTSTYIALCAKVCKYLGIPFEICREEADSGLAAAYRVDPAGRKIVSLDSDMLAHGVKHWISVVDWYGGSAVLIDVESLGTHVQERGADGKERYPLLKYFLKWGVKVFRVWAGFRGCDYSTVKSGILGVGETGLFKAFEAIYQSREDLTIVNVALSTTPTPQMPQTPKDTAAEVASVVAEVVAVVSVVGEVSRVGACFTGARYYTEAGSVRQLDNDKILIAASDDLSAHRRGERDPKTGLPFDLITQDLIDNLCPGTLCHNHIVDASAVPGAVLPKPLMECDVAALRLFISARGGTSSGLRKVELQEITKYWQELEVEVPPRFVDRSGTSGLMLTGIKSNHSKSAWVILDDYLKDPNVQASMDPFPLHKFLKEVEQLHGQGEVSENMDDIILHAPELNTTIIDLLYSSLGGSDEKKSVRESFQKACELSGVIFHANGRTDHTLIIVSKQRASLSKDEATRKDTAAGEKPLAEEYLTFLELKVKSTDVANHGHSLGVVTGIGRHWCPCTAGRALCVHVGMALWTQLHHWGPNRPTDMPPTSVLCGWSKGARKRKHLVTHAVHEMTFEKIERNRPTKRHHTSRESEVGGASYNPIPAGDRAFMNAAVGPSIFNPLFRHLEASTMK